MKNLIKLVIIILISLVPVFAQSNKTTKAQAGTNKIRVIKSGEIDTAGINYYQNDYMLNFGGYIPGGSFNNLKSRRNQKFFNSPQIIYYPYIDNIININTSDSLRKPTRNRSGKIKNNNQPDYEWELDNLHKSLK